MKCNIYRLTEQLVAYKSALENGVYVASSHSELQLVNDLLDLLQQEAVL